MGEEEKSVLDLAVDELNRLSVALEDMGSTLYLVGYVAVEIRDELKALNQNVKAIVAKPVKVVVDLESFVKASKKASESQLPETAKVEEVTFPSM